MTDKAYYDIIIRGATAIDVSDAPGIPGTVYAFSRDVRAALPHPTGIKGLVPFSRMMP